MIRPTDLDELLSVVEDFGERTVAPNAQAWDRDRVMAVDALREAATLGLLGIEVPVSQGGLGMDFGAKVAVIDALSRSSMAFAFSLVNTHNVAANIARRGTDVHKERYLDDLLHGRRFGSTALSEPGAGSDFAAITTLATPVDGGWRLDGEKAWITNAAESDVIVCYVQTEKGAGAKGIASFLIDGRRDGFVRSAPHDLYGGHTIGTGGFVLDGYLATDDDLLAPAGEAFKAALSSINGARTYVAVMCCAMLRASLGIAVDYGAQRHTFGRPIIEHQGLAWSLADIANRLEAAQALTDRAIDAVSNGSPADAVLPAAHAKKCATEAAEPGIAGCIQAMGAAGLRSEYPLGRHLAAARIAHFTDGSTEIQTDRIARSLVASYGRSST